jgi:glycosyltransferase involved in cell wall biosynthesis
MYRPKLLHIIDTLGRGGAETLLVHLLPALQACGFHCEVAALRPPYDVGPELEHAGVIVHRLEIGSQWSIHKALGRLTSLVRRGNFEILHAQLFPATLYCALTKILLTAPRRVVTFQNLDYELYPTDTMKKKWLKLANTILMRHCVDAHVAVSERVAEHYREHLGLESITVIQNAVNANVTRSEVDCQSIRAQYGFSFDEFLIVMPCRFVPQKGHCYLFDAVELLRARGISTKVLLLGRGPMEADLLNEIHVRGLANDIKIHPSLPRIKLMQIVQAADLFVMPSTHEGFPLAATEAMLLARPVVATAVGGLPELIENDVSGILVPPRDPEALANGIRRLFSDPALRVQLGENGRDRVLERFSTEAIVPRWESFYQDLCRATH